MIISALLSMPQLADVPIAPPSGQTKLCFTADGKLLSIDQTGTDQLYPPQAALVVDVFAAPNPAAYMTWTKPPGTTHLELLLQGGGGGGSSGTSYPAIPATGAGHGGTGGNGGTRVYRTFPAALVGATVSCYIGLGGKGGSAGASPPAAALGPQTGGAGQMTLFGYSGTVDTGTIALANGGSGGANAGVPTALVSPRFGSKGGYGQYNVTDRRAGQPYMNWVDHMPHDVTAGGGGGGGGLMNGTADAATGNGGNGGYLWGHGGSAAITAPGGGLGGGDGGVGQSHWNLLGLGGGGGGSQLGATTRGGRGGDGGFYGGGGGGGGSSTWWAGDGGDGGDGVLIVLSRR